MRVLPGILSALLLAGCGAIGLPRPLDPHEDALLRRTKIPMVLGIERAYHEDIGEELIAVLRKHHVFRAVGFADALPAPADLVGRIEYEVQDPGAVIPLFTIISLGIIPSIYPEGHEIGLRFEQTRIETHTTAPLLIGWAGLLLRLSPNWSLQFVPHERPGNNRRIARHLAVALVRRADELQRLARRP